MENEGAVQRDMDGVGIEGSAAAVVAEKANGEKRPRGERGKDMCDAGRGGKGRMQVKSGCVGGCDGSAIGEYNLDGSFGELSIGVRSSDVNVVAGTAAVDNTSGRR